MVKQLQRHGNSVALVFDKTMLEAMNMTPDTPLQITFHGNGMTIAPVNVGVPEEELDETIARLRPRYKKMLENLSK
jgi:antitoxin component of MazEF toxin-antitoxin module